MGFKLTDLKEIRKSILPAMILMMLILFTGCDPYAGKYPDSEPSTWGCADPPITMSYLEDDGVWETTDQSCILLWDGQEIPIEFYYQSNTYSCCFAGTNSYEDDLFAGTWEYPRENWIPNKDKVIFHINRDQFFSGQYEELVFVRVE